MERLPKVPPTAPERLTWDASEVVGWTDPVWRVHFTRGAHPASWHTFRSFGPVPGCRWDPHPPPMGDHPGHEVMYVAATAATALAEVFQEQRIIYRRPRQPVLTGWRPTRPLRLVDLTGLLPLRSGSASALLHGDWSTCQTWARAISATAAETGEEIDGILAVSTLTNETMPVLFGRASTALPEHPSMSRALRSEAMTVLLTAIARQIGYAIA